MRVQITEAEKQRSSFQTENINRVKNLILSNVAYRYLVQSFGEWLDVQGYAPSTVYNLPLHIRELLNYLEGQKISSIQQLTPQHIEAHYHNLKERPVWPQGKGSQRKGGGLSNAHLNKHIQALRKFTEYLRKVGRLEIPNPTLGNEQADRKITYLTESEIRMLYRLCR